MSTPSVRLTNIDMLRGIVMILMCIDHARDYTLFHPSDPMILSATPFSVWLLRVLAHFCAPTFIFLAGISIWMAGRRKEKADLSSFLFVRGAILCLLEITIVNWAWSFNPCFHTIYLQIIWAMGISMMAMGALIHLPRHLLAVGCMAVLLLHNLSDGVRFEENSFMFYLWSLLIQKNLLPLGEHLMARTTYPVLPVIALMGLGYAVGKWYTHLDAATRKKNLRYTAFAMLGLFVLFRLVIGYGDSSPVETGKGVLTYFMSALNTTKYPLSLDFILLYLSIPILILSVTDGKEIKGITVTLGRVPMFFYILHIYLLHAIILLWLAWQGEEIDFSRNLGGVAATTGYPMEFLWLVIPFTVAVLYIPCKWYYGIRKKKRYAITKYL